ncbi:MAG: transposase [Verrucomicrobiota bacterium]
MLRKILRQAADFSGVELLTYVVMGNHFHVLVRVSEAARNVADSELLRRYKVLYPKPTKYQAADIAAVEQILSDNGEDASQLRAKLTARMGHISEFMRTVKQRFSIWYNKSHQRYGPLWCDRFRSAIVENDPVVLKTVAAYIDLNPVRAGLVEDPKDYRFCGYAEALGGDALMQQGLQSLVGKLAMKQVLADYRMLLFGKGARPKSDGSGVRMTEEASTRVMENQGALAGHIVLRQRIRYFSEGMAIGTSLFVNELIQEWSPQIGDRRKRRPMAMKTFGRLTSFKRLNGST